jgi:hypothetical protein
MKERTILQRIADTLEAAGIAVSAIETWPADEDGRIPLSLSVRLPPPKSGRDSCDYCEGGCDTCPRNPANSDRIKTYTPEEDKVGAVNG